MSSMESNEFKPVVIEIAEVGKEVIRLIIKSEQELEDWSKNSYIQPPEEHLNLNH